MNEKDIFREKDINEKRLSRSKPKCSFSIQTQKTILSVSSTQRMLVHMDTQGERMQDKITRVQDNFQRVGQSRTQIMLEEEEKEVINQLQDRKRYMGQIESEDLANHSIKRSMSSTTSESCANGLFNKSSANDPFSRIAAPTVPSVGAA